MDRTIIEDRAGHGKSRDSFSLSCDGTAAGIAGAVDRQDCTLGLSQGHAGVNLIPSGVGHIGVMSLSGAGPGATPRPLLHLASSNLTAL